MMLSRRLTLFTGALAAITIGLGPVRAQTTDKPAGQAAAVAKPAASAHATHASGKRADYEVMVAAHAKTHNLPEALIHRVIVRESNYRPDLVSHGNIGLMQIKLGTARSLGYTGTAEGLRDPETNLTYAVKYLAGAYKMANGDHSRAISYYARGYYYAAKRQQRDSRAVAQAIPAPPRLDELTEAKATVGGR